MSRFRLVSNERDIVLNPGVFIIGRGRLADLMLRGEGVSRKHALLRISKDRVVVEDIGSRNGVTVNGVRIQRPTVLRHRDCIAVGDARVHLVRGFQPAAESMRPSGPPTREFQPPEVGHDDRTLRAPPM